jgi:hypothetical protein
VITCQYSDQDAILTLVMAGKDTSSRNTVRAIHFLHRSGPILQIDLMNDGNMQSYPQITEKSDRGWCLKIVHLREWTIPLIPEMSLGRNSLLISRQEIIEAKVRDLKVLLEIIGTMRIQIKHMDANNGEIDTPLSIDCQGHQEGWIQCRMIIAKIVSGLLRREMPIGPLREKLIENENFSLESNEKEMVEITVLPTLESPDQIIADRDNPLLINGKQTFLP